MTMVEHGSPPSGGEIEIRLGLPLAMREAAGELIFDAFSRKLRLIVGSDPQTAARTLAKKMDTDMAIVAMSGGEVVGIAGLALKGRRFANHGLGSLAGDGGLVSWLLAPLRLALTAAIDTRVGAGELGIEVLAVDGTMRGRGVGSTLLAAVDAHARELGMEVVRLDVVDTNTGARRLYERAGFVSVKEFRLPILRPIFGFGGYTSMVKRLDPQRAHP